MYIKGSVYFGETFDSRTFNYDSHKYFYLPHSCDNWVIGGKEQVLLLIKDLQEALKNYEDKNG